MPVYENDSESPSSRGRRSKKQRILEAFGIYGKYADLPIPASRGERQTAEGVPRIDSVSGVYGNCQRLKDLLAEAVARASDSEMSLNGVSSDSDGLMAGPDLSCMEITISDAVALLEANEQEVSRLVANLAARLAFEQFALQRVAQLMRSEAWTVYEATRVGSEFVNRLHAAGVVPNDFANMSKARLAAVVSAIKGVDLCEAQACVDPIPGLREGGSAVENDETPSPVAGSNEGVPEVENGVVEVPGSSLGAAQNTSLIDGHLIVAERDLSEDQSVETSSDLMNERGQDGPFDGPADGVRDERFESLSLVRECEPDAPAEGLGEVSDAVLGSVSDALSDGSEVVAEAVPEAVSLPPERSVPKGWRDIAAKLDLSSYGFGFVVEDCVSDEDFVAARMGLPPDDVETYADIGIAGVGTYFFYEDVFTTGRLASFNRAVGQWLTIMGREELTPEEVLTWYVLLFLNAKVGDPDKRINHLLDGLKIPAGRGDHRVIRIFKLP